MSDNDERSGAQQVAGAAGEDEKAAEDFRGIYLRIEILAIAGCEDRVALYLARNAANASVASALNPGAFCGMLMALGDEEVWPSKGRRLTSVLEACAGGVVLWLYASASAAQAALPMLTARGAKVLR